MSIFGKENQPPKGLLAFALFDKATVQYNTPVFFQSELEARRATELMFSDPRQKDAMPVVAPQDYCLFHIGYYDKETAKFTAQQPRAVIQLHELKAFLDQQPKS